MHGKTEKKKKKNKKKQLNEHQGEAVENQYPVAIEKKLLNLTRKIYKRMLIHLDTDSTWFEQVSVELSESYLVTKKDLYFGCIITGF